MIQEKSVSRGKYIQLYNLCSEAATNLKDSKYRSLSVIQKLLCVLDNRKSMQALFFVVEIANCKSRVIGWLLRLLTTEHVNVLSLQ